MKEKYKEENIRPLIEKCNTITEVIEELGLVTRGGNYKTIKKYINKYDIDTSHFNSEKRKIKALKDSVDRRKIPLDKILVKNSTYRNTTCLKERLYKRGLKNRKCELCGQGEKWNGRKMSLILDHINGINNDHELKNLRIVCPNCNATLDTHGGKNVKHQKIKKICKNKNCRKLTKNDKFCSSSCYEDYQRGRAKKDQRKVERPPYDQLIEEIKELGYCGTGRKYGVSDNAIRKWKRWYEKHKGV